MKYTVVSAVHNVENYLNDFFKSIIGQTLNFENYIQLIMVDDGSSDNSANIIKKWQKKYPESIIYIKKENGGQASARNFGLEYLQTPWVTFIDSDDFIDKEYFGKVDQTISRYQESDLVMVGCNIQYYFEKLKLYLDRHPLKYRFESGNTHSLVKDLKRNIQLSASAAFFRTDLIQATQLKFDTKIKPNFEDAHFVNAYLIENYSSSVSFLKDAKYYYRRRRIKNSTIDMSWKKKELFDDVLHFGCLDLFVKAKNELGFIPKFLERTILYHLSWYYKYIIDHQDLIGFLSFEEQLKFKSLLKKNFDNISMDTIENFDLSGIDDYIKQGWGRVYKQSRLSYQIVYIDKQNQKMYLHYYAEAPQVLHIHIDGVPIGIPDVIRSEHTFIEENFINKYQFELPITHTMKRISVKVESYQTYLQTDNKKSLDEIDISSIKRKSIKNIKQLLYNFARKIILGN